MRTINPKTWFPFGRKAAETSPRSGISAAQSLPALGAWQATLGTFEARQISPHLFEAMREAVPIIDAGINRLVELDGIVRVEGNNQALVDEINAWMETVRVNDAETGLQAFYTSQGNEANEQGFGVGEWTARKDGKGIDRLRVADSKGIVFVRDGDKLRTYYRAVPSQSSGSTGLDTVESLLRRTPNLSPATLLDKDYVELDPRRLLYVAVNPEADNPYGTSMLRSLELTTQVLLRIQNAMGRAWTRFGDPPLHMQYKTKNARITETQLDARRKTLASELATTLQAKENGNSIDLVTATGMLDEIMIDVIGAASVAMDPEQPLKHITDQICAKFGLPPWLLGVDGTVGAGQAERQSEMVLQSSKTRFERRRPSLTGLVATHLRLAGRTWKAGDWELVQELPNLQDMMKIAQAEFLHAQAAMVGSTREAPQGIDNNLRAARSPRGKRTGSAHTKTGGDDDLDGEPWAEDSTHLTRIERRGIRDALARWWVFASQAAAVLGFDVVRNTITARDDADAWAFPHERMPDLLVLAQQFVINNTADDSPVLGAAWDAWVRGATNAAAELSVEAEIARFHDLVRTALRTRGGELISNTFARAWQDRILSEMASGAWDGMNPVTVAAGLQRKFGAGEYDWERLTRSEMAAAQSRAKREIYIANGLEQYDYTTAGDDKVSAICLTLAAGGPYEVNDPSAPLPMLSSHPGCRCSISPHIAG